MAFFGPEAQILAQKLKNIVLEASWVQKKTSQGQKQSHAEIGKIGYCRPPKTPHRPPRRPWRPLEAKNGQNHHNSVQSWYFFTKNQFWRGSIFFGFLTISIKYGPSTLPAIGKLHCNSVSPIQSKPARDQGQKVETCCAEKVNKSLSQKVVTV